MKAQDNTRLEKLLLERSFGELNKEEAAYALEECGTAEDYARMRQLMLAIKEEKHREDELIPLAGLKEKILGEATSGLAKRRGQRFIYTSAAAAVLLLIGTVWYFSRSGKEDIPQVATVTDQEIPSPARNDSQTYSNANAEQIASANARQQNPPEARQDRQGQEKDTPAESKGNRSKGTDGKSASNYNWNFGDGNNTEANNRSVKTEQEKGRPISEDPELLGLLFTAR